ncbi:MAG: hypothetical protein LBR73_02995 [Oscillospiraceae bacterium]|nr:hypothetical protein [Oscillospiraceae bacterium]
MKKYVTRILSALLSILLCAGCLAVTVSADPATEQLQRNLQAQVSSAQEELKKTDRYSADYLAYVQAAVDNALLYIGATDVTMDDINAASARLTNALNLQDPDGNPATVAADANDDGVINYLDYDGAGIPLNPREIRKYKVIGIDWIDEQFSDEFIGWCYTIYDFAKPIGEVVMWFVSVGWAVFQGFMFVVKLFFPLLMFI